MLSRATRGTGAHRSQPHKRFTLAVKARIADGNALHRGESIGNSAQGYLGPVIGDKLPYIATSSRADFLSAFNKRVNYKPEGRVAPFIRASARHLCKELVPVPMPIFDWDTELFEVWVNQFDQEKQKRMRQAYHTQGLEKIGDYSRKELFTKIEALVKDHDIVAPRVIFKGTDYYNMIAGPIFKVLLERFKSCETNPKRFEFRLAYKQHTPEIVSFLESSKSRSWLESDFSRNDCSQVSDVIDMELWFMARLGCPRWFLKLHKIAAARYSVYNTKYGVSAVAENQLATGVVDTTFRNSFWNLVIYNAWSHKYRVRKAKVVVLGDDILVGLPRRVRRAAKHYEQVAAAARMVAKVTTSPCLHRMHFLSKHFVPVCRGEEAHVMLPLIGKVLAKFNVRPNANLSVTDDEFMAGKSLSHCYEFRFCHILRDLFVERANYHLARSGGKYSLEGITYHVKQFSVHHGMIEKMLEGSVSWPDLVTSEDLSMFWIGLADLSFSDVYPLAREVVVTHGFCVLDNYALSNLVDY